MAFYRNSSCEHQLNYSALSTSYSALQGGGTSNMFNWLICHMIVWDPWPSPFAHAFDGIIGHFGHIMNMQMIIGCFEAEHAINKPIDQRHKFLVLR